MGVDLAGIHPSSEVGEAYYSNWWLWHPIVCFVAENCPHILRGDDVPGWDVNEGNGLDAERAIELADALDKAIADGTVERYVKEHAAYLAGLPDEVCWCGGTGKLTADQIARRREEGIEARDDETCSHCNGTGTKRPFETWYRADAGAIRNFSEFCRASGGFEIW